jgi:hypothetical protein
MPFTICEDCGKAYGVGQWPHCPHGRVTPIDAQIHSSEKVTVFANPTTGEVRIPGRGDIAINPKLAAAGFTERRTIDTHTQLRGLEKQTGTIHEVSNYNKNSATADRDYGSR